MTESLRVYIAGGRDLAGLADSIAADLSKLGVTVVSTWHVGQDKLVDPAAHETRATILAKNLADLKQADVVLALMFDGKPRATFGEIGHALADGARVVWWAKDGDDERACIFDAHPSVTRVTSLRDAVKALEQLEVVLRERFAWQQASIRSEVLHRMTRTRAQVLARELGQAAQDPMLIGPILGQAGMAMRTLESSPDWLTVAVDALAMLMVVQPVGREPPAPASTVMH